MVKGVGVRVRVRVRIKVTLILCCAMDTFQWIKTTIWLVKVLVRVRITSGHNTLQASRLTSLK